MITICSNCDNVEPASKKGPPRSWLCMAHKNIVTGFVSDDVRVHPPYLRCDAVNGGACPLYKQLEVGQVKMNLQEKE